ncbi:endogenous retrovirus group FC1 Env polyprotein-like [Tursiops truncatus]|uniref:endogenous retrovirus group FC1 Env polyprotein-like n=1 Tax=Tursiops truncatus TaxID=9739 RepID=UPI003CCF2368
MAAKILGPSARRLCFLLLASCTPFAQSASVNLARFAVPFVKIPVPKPGRGTKPRGLQPAQAAPPLPQETTREPLLIHPIRQKTGLDRGSRNVRHSRHHPVSTHHPPIWSAGLHSVGKRTRLCLSGGSTGTRSSLRQSHLLTTNGKGQLFINIKDPWDTRWVKGVQGKIYRWATDAYPVGSIGVFRSYISLIPKVIQQLSEQATAIQETEQALRHQLPHPEHKEDPFSSLTLVHQAVQILNHTGIEHKLQLAIEASAGSISSLQHQITSIAQVTLQNRRRLDLLTANKGGTCLFLQEECCYYINETGLIET